MRLSGWLIWSVTWLRGGCMYLKVEQVILLEFGFLYWAVPKPPIDDEDYRVLREELKTYLLMGLRDLPSHVDHLVTLTLDGDIIMPPKAMSEARMREVIREQVAASMAEFMENMNRGAGGDEAGGSGAGGAGVGSAGPAALEITGYYVSGLRQPRICVRISDLPRKDKVKFYNDATLQGLTLTWWKKKLFYEHWDAANEWLGAETSKVSSIFVVGQRLRGDVTSSRPAGIDEAVRMAYQLMGQIIQDKMMRFLEGEKDGKVEGDRGGHGETDTDYNVSTKPKKG
ncbi:hypothetical protein Tco_0537640 [Tanacetum coccineum]